MSKTSPVHPLEQVFEPEPVQFINWPGHRDDDDMQRKAHCKCSKCPFADSCSKTGWSKVLKTSYISADKVRMNVCNHLSRSTAHQLRKKDAQIIAMNEEETVVEEWEDTFEEREAHREKMEAQQQHLKSKSELKGDKSPARSAVGSEASMATGAAASTGPTASEAFEESVGGGEPQRGITAAEIGGIALAKPGQGKPFTVVPVKSGDELILLKMSLLDQMRNAFEEVASGLTDVLREATKMTGRLTTQEEQLRKLILTIDRIKARAVGQ